MIMSENSFDELMPYTPNVGNERLAELRRLFPDLFDGEGHLKLDDLKQLTGELPPQRERYDFTWSGKQNAKAEAYRPTTATLSYDEGRSINPEKADGNLIIEGENLAALKCLLPAYKGQVKCIYIDPPYNTGKDFVYSDNYSEGRQPYWEQTGGTEQGVKIDTNPDTAGRYHSNWLNMIYPRLILARLLMADEGIIFVSIDDNEVSNLKKVLDEVFGEENFLVEFAWRSEGNFDNQAKFKICHEYILCYAKVSSLTEYPPVIDPNTPKNSKLFKDEIINTIVKNGPKNPVSDVVLPPGFPVDFESGVLETREDKWPHYKNSTKVEEYQTVSSVTVSSGWSSKDQLLEYIENGCNEIVDNKGQITSFSISATGAIETRKKRAENQSHVISWLNGLGGPQKASRELEEQGLVFNGYPKPVKLIKYLISMVADKDCIVLDFFAGSGTTGQAMVELNKDDGGNRTYIQIQLPELLNEPQYIGGTCTLSTISDITIKRNEQISFKYPEIGFKVFKLTKSHFPRLEFSPDPEKSEEENIEAFRAYIQQREAQLIGLFPEESTTLIDEVLLKNGFRLDYSMEKVDRFSANTVWRVSDGYKETLLCLDNTLQAETASDLIATPQPFICLEGALDTSTKWNLKQHLKELFVAF